MYQSTCRLTNLRWRKACRPPQPPPVNVFLSHNSPRVIHDRDDGIHVGFDGLNAHMSRAKPKLLIHGHQHVERETIADGTRVLGVYGWELIEVQGDATPVSVIHCTCAATLVEMR